MRSRSLIAFTFSGFIFNHLQVISVGFIEGGQAGKVIPEMVKFGGTFRSMSTEGLSYLMQRIKEVCVSKKILKKNSLW